MAGTISAVTAAKAASVTTAIAAATATIAAAVAIARWDNGACLGLVEAIRGRGFAAFGELFVEHVLFGVGLVELLLLFLFGFFEIAEVFEGGVEDGVLFFEVVLFLFFVDVAGASDLIDRHLADHGAEIGGSFECLLLFEVIIHLFDGAGVKCGVVVLFVESLFDEGSGAGDEGRGWSFRGEIPGGVERGYVMSVFSRIGWSWGRSHWGRRSLPIKPFESWTRLPVGWLGVRLGYELV
jgi:hypothetical protein